MAKISTSIFKIFKIFTCLTSGLSLALEDNKITIGEMADILGNICRILDIPFYFEIPEEIKTLRASVEEIVR